MCLPNDKFVSKIVLSSPPCAVDNAVEQCRRLLSAVAPFRDVTIAVDVAPNGRAFAQVAAPTRKALARASICLKVMAERPAEYPEEMLRTLLREGPLPRFVFVDHSNLLFSAQSIDETHDASIRINVAHLTELLRHGRAPAECRQRLFATVPEGRLETWRGYFGRWAAGGYDVDVHTRKRQEGFFDSIIHSAMLEEIMAGVGVLALVTGDGKRGEESTFPGVLEIAILRGWDVEVWGFRHAMSGAYEILQAKYGGKVRLVFLDDWRDRVLFEKGVEGCEDGAEGKWAM
jgi:hypothetical protein